MYEKNAPYSLPAKEGEAIYICQCGKTSNAPLCDGSHKTTNVKGPVVYNASKDENLYVCGCGKSDNMPWCDGSHKSKA